MTLIVLLALVGIGCGGTDGLEIPKSFKNGYISFTNAGDLAEADYVPAGQQYSFTLTINTNRGAADDVNLTSFTEGGDWLNAQVVNNGAAIELSGTPTSSDAYTEYSYAVTAVQGNDKNVSTSFSVYVDN
ncbi:hypothetical protein [Fodinibius salinus]|nr:hypothetical protein [Fodinibius salinus]